MRDRRGLFEFEMDSVHKLINTNLIAPFFSFISLAKAKSLSEYIFLLSTLLSALCRRPTLNRLILMLIPT